MTTQTKLKSVKTIKPPVDSHGQRISWFRQLLLMRRDFLGYLTDISTHSDIVKLRFFPTTTTLMIVKPEYIAELLEQNSHYLKKSRYQQRIAGPLLGNGVNLAEGEAHAEQRKVLVKAFSTRKLKQYTQTIVETTTRKLARCKQAGEIDLEHTMHVLTFQIISKLILGKTASARDNIRISMQNFADSI